MSNPAVKYIILLSFILSLNSQAQESPIGENPIINNQKVSTHAEAFKKGRNGNFVIDSTHNYLGNTFGQDWFYYQRYMVSERDQWGNFLSAITHEFDTIGNNWIQHQQYEASYFDSVTTAFWNAHVWDAKADKWRMSDSTTFNSAGDPVINWYKVWDPVKFRFWRGQRIKYYYQSEKLTNREVQIFDTLSGNWAPGEYYSYTYNQDDLLSNELIMEWDSSGNDWKNLSNIQYTYDEELLIQSEITQLWNDEKEWENSVKYEYEYFEESNKLKKQTRYSWLINSWDVLTQTLYSYNENLMLVEALSQVWVEFENKWYNTGVYSYVYNPQGQRTEILFRSWDFGGFWVNESQTLYSYDDDGNQLQYVFRIWDDEYIEWDNYYKSINFWSEFVPFGMSEVSELKVHIFPNPTSGMVFLSHNENVEKMSIALYSIDGRLMANDSFHSNQRQLNLDHLPGGKYLLVVDSKEKRFTQMIIKK